MPKKRFGQHFLSDPAILGQIVDFSRIGPGDTVVEIGPGRGALTKAIATRVRRVVAVEIDRDLAEKLRTSVPANVQIVEGDALGTDLTAVSPEPYHLLGNLPYNIATPLLERIVEARPHILSVTVMIQREVADRILAGPGNRDYSPLSIGIQYYAEVERGFGVPPGAFTPRPKVDSAVIRLTWRDNVADAPALMKFVRKAFRSRRKKLVNNLMAMYGNKGRENLIDIVKAVGIDADARPEDLSVEDYLRLFRAIKPLG